MFDDRQSSIDEINLFPQNLLIHCSYLFHYNSNYAYWIVVFFFYTLEQAEPEKKMHKTNPF